MAMAIAFGQREEGMAILFWPLVGNVDEGLVRREHVDISAILLRTRDSIG